MRPLGRPRWLGRPEQMVASYLKKDELALYELIWKRFVASQMSPAELDQTIMQVAAGEYDATSQWDCAPLSRIHADLH